jgi:hypothetical protein
MNYIEVENILSQSKPSLSGKIHLNRIWITRILIIWELFKCLPDPFIVLSFSSMAGISIIDAGIITFKFVIGK